MNKIAFFDVDHTVTRKSSARAFIIQGVKIKMFPIRMLLSIPFIYLYYRFGRMNSSSIKLNYPFLQGIPKNKLEELSIKSFRGTLINEIYQNAHKLIKDFHRQGSRVVLATSSLDIIVEPLAQFLNISDTIATSIEFKNGICTGNILEGPNFEREKKKKVLEFIEKNGVSPENCSFYSDSIHDLSLLESVGFPVVVNPDRRLKKIARKRDWQILTFRGLNSVKNK